jgi:hypothetical protein
MVSADLASSFWAVVQDCLVQFHGFQNDAASENVSSFRCRLPKGDGQKPSFDDLIYHAEPFYIACDLAGEELPLSQYQAAYETLLKKNQLA